METALDCRFCFSMIQRLWTSKAAMCGQGSSAKLTLPLGSHGQHRSPLARVSAIRGQFSGHAQRPEAEMQIQLRG